MKRLAVVLLPVLLLAALPMLAQTAGARLSGTVTDSSGAVIADATVTVRNQATGITQTTTTGTTGIFIFRALQPGSYDIKAEKSGFQTIEAKGLTLLIGQDLGYDLTMKVGATSEVVNVTAETPLVETQKSSVDTVITREELLNMPLDGRYFLDLIFISTPGVTGRNNGGLGENLSVNGQRGFANSFNVDGATATNSLLMSTTGRINVDSIQEFQVLTHQFEAQHGNASGAVVNVATRGGTNAFHGTGYGFFNNSELNAYDAYQKKVAFESGETPEKPESHRYSYGGTFGGPVIKDKLFFFGSYEWEADKWGVSILAPQEFGQVVQQGPVTNLWSGRMDYSTGKNSITFRYNGQRSNGVWGVGGFNTKSTQFNEIFQPQSFQVSWNRTFSPTTLGEFRAQFLDYQDHGDGVTTTGYEIVRPSSVEGKLSNVPFNSPEYNGQIVYNLSMTRGHHDIKVGGSYMRIVSDGANRNFGDGVYYFNTDAPFNANDPATYPYRYLQRFGADGWHIPENVMGVFAQDKWNITHNLVLNYGLRYDFENFFTSVAPIATLTGKIAQNPKADFSPRLSAAYTPFDKKTVFRGGYGRFYSRVPLNEAALVIINTVNTATQTFLDLWAGDGYQLPYPAVPPRDTQFHWASSSIDVLNDNLHYQYTDQFTFGVQRELSRTFSLNADFVRILGHNLWTYYNANAPDPATGEVPNPNWWMISAQSSIGSSWYSAMELTLKHNAGRHSFVLTYTRAKAIDNVRGDPNGYGATCNRAIMVNGPSAINCDRGLGANDLPHRITFDGSYRLPLGIVVSSVVDWHPGYPWTIAAGYDVNGDGYTNDRPAGVGRNTERGTRYIWWQGRVGKEIKLRESMKLNLFTEAFNVTNTVSDCCWVGNQRSVYFGQPTGDAGGRRVQFGFRMAF